MQRDLTGQRFGRLVVVSQIATSRNDHKKPARLWHCRCDCGNEIDVPTSHLTSGVKKSCGCLQRDNAIRAATSEEVLDRRRKRPTTWVLIDPDGNPHKIDDFPDWAKENYRYFYPDDTDSSTAAAKIVARFYTNYRVMRTGKNVNPYHFRGWGIDMDKTGDPQQPIKNKDDYDLTGKRFGRLTVVSKTGRRENATVIWQCRCDCGKTVFAKASLLKDGHVKSCGCLRADNAKQVSQGRQRGTGNTEKVPGICFVASRSRYNVFSCRGGKSIYITSTKQIDDAIKIRDQAETIPDDELQEWILGIRKQRKEKKQND